MVLRNFLLRLRACALLRQSSSIRLLLFVQEVKRAARLKLRPSATSEEGRGVKLWMLYSNIFLSLLVSDVAWKAPLLLVQEEQTWASCFAAALSGRHNKAFSVFMVPHLSEWHMSSERSLAFGSWETMWKSLWLSGDVGDLEL